MTPTGDRANLRALYAGIAVPILYYGSQALAAPFFPGFSFVGTTASELGSDLSRHRTIFNFGTLVLGMASLVASVGFLRAFHRLGTHPVLAWPASLAVAMSGVQSLWAGYFPMPDPRHGGHPVFIAFMLAMPPLLAASLWRQGGFGLRAYLVVTLLLLAAMVPLMSGMSGLDTHEYRGLLQRVFALTVFPPIGVAAWVLSTRIKATTG